jgi:hypothetical protein
MSFAPKGERGRLLGGFHLQGIYWRNRGHVCIVYLDTFVQLSGGPLTACNYDNIVLIGQVIQKRFDIVFLAYS